MAYIPFETIDDDITEFRENFRIVLSVPKGEYEGKYSTGGITETDVFIEDNESN